MRYLLFLFLAASISCKKQTYHPSTIPGGIYKGTFQRKGIQDGLIANVTLTFSNDKWAAKVSIQNTRPCATDPFQLMKKAASTS